LDHATASSYAAAGRFAPDRTVVFVVVRNPSGADGGKGSDVPRAGVPGAQQVTPRMAVTMPTYKLGPGTRSAVPQAMFRRPLICEACLEALGNVHSVVRHEEITAQLVTALWPEMGLVVKRHAALCREGGKKPS
jgi:hypothetical protein